MNDIGRDGEEMDKINMRGMYLEEAGRDALCNSGPSTAILTVNNTEVEQVFHLHYIGLTGQLELLLCST